MPPPISCGISCTMRVRSSRIFKKDRLCTSSWLLCVSFIRKSMNKYLTKCPTHAFWSVVIVHYSCIRIVFHWIYIMFTWNRSTKMLTLERSHFRTWLSKMRCAANTIERNFSACRRCNGWQERQPNQIFMFFVRKNVSVSIEKKDSICPMPMFDICDASRSLPYTGNLYSQENNKRLFIEFDSLGSFYRQHSDSPKRDYIMRTKNLAQNGWVAISATKTAHLRRMQNFDTTNTWLIRIVYGRSL